MSALPKPDFPREHYVRNTQLRTTVSQHQEVVRQAPTRPAKVIKSRNFTQSNSIPQKLQVLSLLQKGSFCLALASMTASIGLYISTVHIPKLWSQEYQNLEDLQRQERQLVSINETIKYQIAKEAGQDSQLAISQPESALFITPAEIKVDTQSQLISNQQQTANLKHSSWGY